MIEYLLYVFGGCLVALAVLAFYKFKKPPKKVEETVSEIEFAPSEGPTIEYDRGLGGSPYCGQATNVKKHGNLCNVTILDEDGAEFTLYNLDVGEMGNLRLVSSYGDLLQGKRPKFRCNKDSTGEIKVNVDGTVWSTQERTTNAILANLMAERRAYAKAIRDTDEFRQLIKIKAPSFYAEHLEEKPAEKEEVKKT